MLEPQERFNAIIDRSEPDHVLLLDNMYTFTLESIFSKEPPSQRDRGLDRFKSVMAQILWTMEPLSLDSLTSMRCHFKDLADIKIRSILAPMAALFSGATDSSVPIRPLHVSFADFLTGPDWSGELFIYVHPIHKDLAFTSLHIMMKKL